MSLAAVFGHGLSRRQIEKTGWTHMPSLCNCIPVLLVGMLVILLRAGVKTDNFDTDAIYRKH